MDDYKPRLVSTPGQTTYPAQLPQMYGLGGHADRAGGLGQREHRLTSRTRSTRVSVFIVMELMMTRRRYVWSVISVNIFCIYPTKPHYYPPKPSRITARDLV